MDEQEVEALMAMRESALLSGDIPKLREYFRAAGEDEAAEAEDDVLEIAVHKSRIHWRDCPPELLHESVWWLHDHGYSLNYDNV